MKTWASVRMPTWIARCSKPSRSSRPRTRRPRPSGASAPRSSSLAERIDRGAAGGIRAGLGARFARTSRRGRATALLAAVLILGGAGGGAVALYEGMVGSGGGSRTAWDRAAILGISQTIDGYRVTIERAYADPNQLMLAISVDDLDGRGWTQVAASGVDVTDEQSRPFGQSMGMSSPDGASAAANLAWLTPPAGLTSGQHTLHVSIPSITVRDNTTPPPDDSSGTAKGGVAWYPWHDVAGPWTFTIPLDVAGGSVAAPQHRGHGRRHGGAPDAGHSLAIVRERDHRGDRQPSRRTWGAVGQFEYRGRMYPIAMSNGSGGGDTITLQTDDGTTKASGEWTLRIDELVGNDGPKQVRLKGPWVIPFSMP